MYKFTKEENIEGIIFDSKENIWTDIMNLGGSGFTGLIFAGQINIPLDIKDGVFVGLTFVSSVIFGSSFLNISKINKQKKKKL